MNFNSKEYVKGHVFPPQQGADFKSESYEWVTDGEAVQNWTTLITTHKMTPLSLETPLKADAYAQNVASMQTTNGAQMLETSVINDPSVADKGIDINNPPYILIYLLKNPNPELPSELNIQKIENLNDGQIGVFIFAKRLIIKDDEDFGKFYMSSEFASIRDGVIFAKMPY